MRHPQLLGLLPMLACMAQSGPECDAGNAGLTLPEGFCAQVVAEGMGRARHLAVARNGDIFVAVPAGRAERGAPGVWILRDTTGDGRADLRVHLLDVDSAQDVALLESPAGGWVYYSTNSAVIRHRWTPGTLEVNPGGEVVVGGMTDQRQHAAKTFVVARDTTLYVNIGAPSNSCQVDDRQARSPGRDPCPLLAVSGGVWRFDGTRGGQTQADGERFATGIRNMVALELHPETGVLWGLQHGRDALGDLWGFTPEQNAELPAEELMAVRSGDDFGWPYCYFDGQAGRMVLAPEFGGDGTRTDRCDDVQGPVVAFPAHWAPNGLVFYTELQFPSRYHGGAFIAFHGSWNRAPLPQEGFNVVYLPMDREGPTGEWSVFADGFRPDSRPVDLVVGPDGSLVVSDDRGGRVFRIWYAGS